MVFLSVAIKMIAAAWVELGNDEVYYWTYAKKLQWNYFDHPPMVAVWVKLFTLNLWLEGYEVFIRLGSILGCAAATLLIFDLTKRLHSERAGWIAALLYNASLYAGIISGLFIMPDSPQMLFWCFALWLLARIDLQPRKWLPWIGFGIAAGLCIMSKVHGVFLWFGFGLFILFKKRNYFALPQLYVAVLLTAIIASPILIWNIQNDFITYRFHSERVTVEKFSLNWTGFAREVFGQFFYNNPFNVVITFLALPAFRKNITGTRQFLSVYNFIALPMILVFILVSLFRNTFPHWSGPAYVALVPLAAIYLAEKNRIAVSKWALGFAAFILVLGLGVINLYPGTLGKKDRAVLGKHDFTLDMYGWREAGSDFDDHRHMNAITDDMSGRHIYMPVNAPMISHKWFPAAHLDYYFCRPSGIELIGLGSMQDLHHYKWMNEWRKKKVNMDTAWCIVPSNLSIDVKSHYQNYYRNIIYQFPLPSKRGGRLTRYFDIYILTGFKGDGAEISDTRF